MSARGETIIAPATPTGVSALAVVRVSGSLACMAGERLLRPFKAEHGRMRHAQAEEAGQVIDDLMYCFFTAPHSYTGEDTLELFCHGNPLVVRRLVRAFLTIPGIRPAEPGEFTLRSFLNGKMDLLQAEAVGQLLHATEERAVRNAQKLLRGDLSLEVQRIAEQVKNMSALLELEVDFAEEETEVDQSGWMPRLMEIEAALQRLARKFREQEVWGRVPRVVIYGAPNAGKSSLINALLREERVLVSSLAGTTRDAVQVRLFLPGGEVELVDTAGLSARPVDELDERAQRKSREMLGKTDEAVLVMDAAAPADEEAVRLLETARMSGHLIVWNKSDLIARQECAAGEMLISCLRGDGLKELINVLNERLFPNQDSEEDFWIASARQLTDIRAALEAVQRSQRALLEHASSPEILAFEFAGARQALARLIGEISADDILHSIFSRFCIGK